MKPPRSKLRGITRKALSVRHHGFSHSSLCKVTSEQALRNLLIEAFVTREGTDYGTQDVSLATKVWEVRQQLDAGTAVIVYDEDTESCTIQPAHQLPDHG